MEPDVSSPDPQDGQLSAYLDGELDPAQDAELEARLAQDPTLAAALDTVAEALVALRGLDRVEPPPGYAGRLRARLAEAREAGADRRPQHRRWLAVGAVAAAAIVLSVLGGALIWGSSAFRAPAHRAAQAPLGAELQLEMAESEVTRLEARKVQPVILDAEAPLADESAARTHFAGLPEATRLLGTPIDQVPELADAARRVITAAPPLRSSVAPGACLDAIEEVGLVAHVESVTYQRQLALAYIVASGSTDARRLDQVQVIVVDPRTCVELLFLTLDT